MLDSKTRSLLDECGVSTAAVAEVEAAARAQGAKEETKH